jgi:hypothetical protein
MATCYLVSLLIADFTIPKLPLSELGKENLPSELVTHLIKLFNFSLGIHKILINYPSN